MPEKGEGGESNTPKETMEALDEVFSTPSRIEGFLDSIEDDLGDATSNYRTFIGVLKRMALRGATSFFVTAFFAGLGGLFAFIAGYRWNLIQATLFTVFVPIWLLVFSEMMTDWLPSVD